MNNNVPEEPPATNDSLSAKHEVSDPGRITSGSAKTNDPRVYEPLEDTISGLILFLLASGVLLLLVFWPWTFGSKSALQAPAKIEFLGALQKISYVGGLGTDTQIHTEGRTLLLHGVKNLRLGVVMETRVDFFGKYVCEVGTENCYGFACKN
jgi:hypothetical protein